MWQAHSPGNGAARPIFVFVFPGLDVYRTFLRPSSFEPSGNPVAIPSYQPNPRPGIPIQAPRLGLCYSCQQDYSPLSVQRALSAGHGRHSVSEGVLGAALLSTGHSWFPLNTTPTCENCPRSTEDVIASRCVCISVRGLPFCMQSSYWSSQLHTLYSYH